jgi:hypothetical protein
VRLLGLLIIFSIVKINTTFSLNIFKGIMTDHYDLWPGTCNCGQIIGDSGRKHRALIASGMNAYEAAKSMGYLKTCCLLSLQTPTTYEMRAAHTGCISDKVLNPQQPMQIISMSDERRKSIGEPVSSQASVFSLNVDKDDKIRREAAISGLTEPRVRWNFDLGKMDRGDVVVTGYQKNADGEIKMVNVGSGYFVPVLTYVIKTSKSQPVGYYNKDLF